MEDGMIDRRNAALYIKKLFLPTIAATILKFITETMEFYFLMKSCIKIMQQDDWNGKYSFLSWQLDIKTEMAYEEDYS